MTDLVEFLRARLDEDEAAANGAALEVGWDGFGKQRIRSGQDWVPNYHVVERVQVGVDAPQAAWERLAVADCGSLRLSIAEHIARHDPARVLREVEAKRRIVDAYEETAVSVTNLTAERAHGAIVMSVEAAMTALHLVIRHHAAVHSDHPDYRAEWKP